MKKILTLIFAIVLCFNVKAQTSLTEAVDFTGTDCYGEEVINLFEILDRGQHVFIDMFFYSCPPCQEVAPMVVEAYEAFGCNKHDVFFMEVSITDDNDICQWWAERYGVEYPTIGVDGGGRDIKDIYTPAGSGAGFPTLILIAPDRKILLQDINYDSIEIKGTQFIIESLEAFGIKQRGCDEEPVVIPEEPLAIAMADSDTTIVLTWESVMGATSYNVYQGTDTIVANLSDTTYTVTGLSPQTQYCYTVTAVNTAGESEKSDEACAKTLSGDALDEMMSNDFMLYPNPASSEIKVISNIKGEADVNIYDMTGRCVKNVRVSDASKAAIDISDMEKGVYLININGKIERFVRI